jgi:putative ABC transport system substrate-binding protein
VGGLAAALAAPPGPARAAVPRVGVLTDQPTMAAILVQGLRDAGWAVPDDLAVVQRGAAGGADRWTAAARALAALPVEVLVAGGHAAVRAAREATAAIPIVAVDFERDPIASGFARSLARPGGNVTGFFCDFTDGMVRLAGALREALPAATRVVALTDGDATDAQARALRAAGANFGLEVETLEAGGAAPETLVDGLAARRTPFVALASPRLESVATPLAKRAVRRKLPSAAAFVRYAHVGGLLARGPSLADAFRRAAATVDRLLRGARAAELAVERPPRFELVVNAKTAAALELTLPPALTARADLVVR